MRSLFRILPSLAVVACALVASAQVVSHPGAPTLSASSARAHAPNTGLPTGPFVAVDAVRSGGGLVFDGGVPDQVDANEMTNWNQAEDFAFAATTTFTTIRFWTLELDPLTWDGVCEFQIYDDAGGAPGALLDSGDLNLVARAATGNIAFGLEEMEYVFDFPSAITLPAGTYWIALHMSTICNTFQNIYWSSTGTGFGALGLEQFGCVGGWNGNGNQHAFQLFAKGSVCPPPDEPYGPTPLDGATNVPPDQVLSWNKSCGTFVNGGFESGDFAGWTTFTTPGLSPLQDWAVVTGGGWFANGAPFEGTFYATNGFDGDAGLVHEIWQEVCIPTPDQASSAVLSWQTRVQWDMENFGGSTMARIYQIEFQPAGGGAPLYTETLVTANAGTSDDTGYLFFSGDVMSIVPATVGTTTRIIWREIIPETFTGPGQLDFDDVSLTIAAPIVGGHGPNGTHDRAATNPRGFTATPTEVAPARMAISDEMFAQRVAMYESVQRGEFASVKDAMAQHAATTPSALRVNAADAPTGPIVPVASLRTGGLVFDGGQPDQISGNEMTDWNQAEDFTLAAATDIESVRFWTIEFDPNIWSGVCEFQIYDDAGGVPGAPLHSGALNLVSRVATGNDVGGLIEMEHVFDFPSVITLPAGGYWIALHMSTVCDVRDDIYWSSTSNGFGAPGQESADCDDVWFTNGVQHAFELYGKAVSSGCPVTYDVYVDTVNPPTTLACSGVSSPFECDPGLLQHCTTYYWQVVANSAGGSTPGPVWSFTTGSPLCPGDTNGDGVVDFADFSTVLAQYGQFGSGLSGDLNCDGVVDFSDFSEVLAVYGSTCP